VKASTSLRTKKRGKVPPRLETLLMLDFLDKQGGFLDLRSQQSHISTPNYRIRNPGMEG
jgi:hypothetical protein